MDVGQSNGNRQSSRQREILELVDTHGFMTIDALAQHFSVTRQTVRSDVNALCRAGALRRYHGGVGPVSTLDNATFAKRRILGHAEKLRIAAEIAAHVPSHAALFIHYGTTMEAVGAALEDHTGLLVVTNNISIVNATRGAVTGRVLLVGGDVNFSERCTCGDAATAFLEQFNVDFGILSVGSVGPDGTLYEYGYEVAQTARVMMRNAKQVYLAVDSRKFNRDGLIRIGNVADVDAVFTDRVPPQAIAATLASCGVALHVAK
jgi:DeoR family glycerol-3-phosphate regulon repressor